MESTNINVTFKNHKKSLHRNAEGHFSHLKTCVHVGQTLTFEALSIAGRLEYDVQIWTTLARNVTKIFDKNGRMGSHCELCT